MATAVVAIGSATVMGSDMVRRAMRAPIISSHLPRIPLMPAALVLEENTPTTTTRVVKTTCAAVASTARRREGRLVAPIVGRPARHVSVGTSLSMARVRRSRATLKPFLTLPAAR